MEKQLFFKKVAQIKDLEGKQKQLSKEWNEVVCWFGSERQQKDHQELEQMVSNRIQQLKSELREARNSLPKKTLQQWKEEYYNRYLKTS